MAMIVLSILTETKELFLLQKFQATGMTEIWKMDTLSNLLLH